MILISLLIFSVYALPMLRFIAANTKKQQVKVERGSSTKVSILIPYRNEAENLQELCHSLLQQNYPIDLLEFIFINDHSIDGSEIQLREYCKPSKFKCNHLSLVKEYGKKAALKSGAEKAQGDFIITTDADCIVPINWVNTMVYEFEVNQKEVIIGPVKIRSGNSLLTHLQETEFAAIMACTTASANLNRAISCNGANLGYSKRLYHELNPYKNRQQIASGDDVFLLFQAKESLPADKIGSVADKNALVETKAIHQLNEFKNQRIRWAKKTNHYKDLDSKEFGIKVVLVNLWLIVQLAYCVYTQQLWWLLAVTFVFKFIVDIALLSSSRKWLVIQHVFSKSFALSIIYPFYLLTFACLSIFSKAKWKGRKVAN